MRSVRDLLPTWRDRKTQPRTVYVGSHEDKLSGLRPRGGPVGLGQ